MPLEIAFKISEESEFITKFDVAVDIFFTADLVLMFLTSFVSKQGIEVKDSIKIAFNYTSQFRFYFDILSLLGTGVFTQYIPSFKLFGLLKILRVFRINGFIKRLKVSTETR